MLGCIVTGWDVDSNCFQSIQPEEWVVGGQPEYRWVCQGGSRRPQDESKVEIDTCITVGIFDRKVILGLEGVLEATLFRR
jgi:hypothetical protein